VLDADEAGERPRPAESAAGPMGKLPHNGKYQRLEHIAAPQTDWAGSTVTKGAAGTLCGIRPWIARGAPVPHRKAELRLPEATSRLSCNTITDKEGGRWCQAGKARKGQKVRLFLY
jgi:hypothetical protein